MLPTGDAPDPAGEIVGAPKNAHEISSWQDAWTNGSSDISSA
jgi:hypothetical protein